MSKFTYDIYTLILELFICQDVHMASSTPNVLGYALLGLLARGEQTGYALSQGLKDPVSFFWHAQHSQIYPELARLEALGLVAHTRIEQTERPDKKVYKLTKSGKEILQDWLGADTDVPKSRDELVLKAYSIWLSDPKAAVKIMDDHAKVHAERKAEFEKRLETITVKAGKEIWQPGSRWFGIHAVLKRGIGYEREYSEWCEWMAKALSVHGQKQENLKQKRKP
jgi:DNA-binding PadR family transcriptional regulator